MQCPKCNQVIPDEIVISESARIIGSKKSELKAKTSRENGKKHVKHPHQTSATSAA